VKSVMIGQSKDPSACDREMGHERFETDSRSIEKSSGPNGRERGRIPSSSPSMRPAYAAGKQTRSLGTRGSCLTLKKHTEKQDGERKLHHKAQE